MKSVLQALCFAWQLNNLKLLAKRSASTIYSAVISNSQKPAVIKIIKNKADFMQELAALTALQNHGSIRLIASNQELNALLLDAAKPGEQLSSFFPSNDQQGFTIATTLIKQLHQTPLPNNSQFPTLPEWLNALFIAQPNSSIIPTELLTAAQKIAHKLFATPGKQVLLHADLHHENILSNGINWVAIDPKGVIGDAAYELAPLLCNPIAPLASLQPTNLELVLTTRIAELGKLMAIDQIIICHWGLVHAVAGACWAEEAMQQPNHWIAIAQVLLARS
jgi:streptomycin 6-kinase